MQWVAAAAAITETDVEKPVRSERDVAAIVIRKRVQDEGIATRPYQIEPAGRVSAQRVGAGPCEPGYDNVAGVLCSKQYPGPLVA